jgi:hypothetical protein
MNGRKLYFPLNPDMNNTLPDKPAVSEYHTKSDNKPGA